MNQYQKFVFEKMIKIYLREPESAEVKMCNVLDDKVVLKQLDDITITKYQLIFEISDINVLQIEYLEGSEWKKTTELFKGQLPQIDIDFVKPINKIKISTPLKLFDDFEIDIEYEMADKEAYYKKIKEEEEKRKLEEQETLNALINPEHKTGRDLVNIYWNYVNDNAKIAKINLYAIFESDNRLIAKYTEEGTMFKSITGLAFGTYCYEIIELDCDNYEIARTKKIEFSLK